MKTINDFIGHWPQGLEEARKEKRHVHIPKEKALTVIHGKENKTKFTFYISTDRCHMGKFEICAGKHSDPEIHKGDEVLMILKGRLQIMVLNELEDETAVSRKAYEVNEGEKFIIPEGYKHQYFNLGKGMTEALFAIAPGL
ncbi:MAG TPA: cupin domain-containing protein [Spirochaetes bacterium]|nr:cupin domain-containing protein [Spirochaetota bacterium]